MTKTQEKGKLLLFPGVQTLEAMEGRVSRAENDAADLRRINIDLRLQLETQSAMLRSFILGNN